jgi:glycyl-tRNA synthetase beta chain
MTTQNLLVELFVEELPPKALKKLGDAFADVLFEQLKLRGLTSPDSDLSAFASPRRLGAHITNVFARGADKEIIEKLMPLAVAIKDGKPTEAFRKRLGKEGRSHLADLWPNAIDGPDSLVVQTDGKTEAVYLRGIAVGGSLLVGLEASLAEAIAKLPIPKVMTYQLADGWSDVKFVRPVHRLLALHGSTVVAVKALGLEASNMTEGHRFESEVKAFAIREADSYESQMLEQGKVIASFAQRKAEIVRQLAAAAVKFGGGVSAIEDDALLDEVTALVERPNVLVCEFEKEFLEVPSECLILTMKANQKYFPLIDAAGKLTNKFLVVSNITPKDASAVIGGNERVVRPRLADAKFFYDQDRKKTLASRVPGLAKVTYHNKLGSQHERMLRVKAIAEWVAARIGADIELAGRAAYLAKADLLTDMVGEFPELQGIMGGYYAEHFGENPSVVAAITDQYLLQGKGPDDESPENLVSVALDIADRTETLVGIWGIGLKPTGEKDPYALRRHSLSLIGRFELLGLAALIDNGKTKLQLAELLDFAQRQFPPGLLDQKTLAELTEFIYDRFHNRLIGLGGHRVAIVDAVVSLRPPLHEIVARVHAVKAFAAQPEAPALAAANKRISNILKKAQDVDAHVSEVLLKEAAEISLYAAVKDITPKANAQFESGDYTASLQTLAALRAPVDAFFDSVMVNAEQVDVRLNRLGLLSTLHAAMNRVADLSRLAA